MPDLQPLLRTCTCRTNQRGPCPVHPNLPDPAKRTLRCGPWDEREDGTHVCRKCGRVDPLDLDLDAPEEST